jgi:hypothetical protein
MNRVALAPEATARKDADSWRDTDDPVPQESIQDIEKLIERLERAVDPEARENAQLLVRAVLELHRTALAKIVELVGHAGEGAAMIGAFGRDDLIGSVLALHGLHPASPEVRARAAIERIAPSGWTLDLLDVAGGALRVRATRSGDPRRIATADRVRALVEQAVAQAAPDAERLEFEGDLGDVGGHSPATFVSVERLRTPGPRSDGRCR